MRTSAGYHSIIRNGIPSSDISIEEHSIFTTILIEGGQPVFWSWHEERLIRDAQLLGTVWKSERISFIEREASGIEEGALRITCTSTDWWIHTWKTYIDEDKPLKSRWVTWKHESPLPAHSKHGYRKNTKRLCKKYGVDVLLWRDEKGDALEASFGNLVSISSDCLYTHPASGDILDGVGRRWILSVAREFGLDVREKCVPWNEGSWWMTSSLRRVQRLDITPDEISTEEKMLIEAFRNRRTLPF